MAPLGDERVYNFGRFAAMRHRCDAAEIQESGKKLSRVDGEIHHALRRGYLKGPVETHGTGLIGVERVCPCYLLLRHPMGPQS